MADYKPAFDVLKAKEGNPEIGWYSNHKDDHGGETLCGITRKNFPNWDGWVLLDYHRHKEDWPRNWEGDAVLWHKIQQFYQKAFWAPVYEKIEEQYRANHIFALAVNCGTSRAHKLVQRMYGLKEDGIFGPKTLGAVNSGSTADFKSRLKTTVGEFYDSLAEADPSQAKFLKSWKSRLA